MTSLLRLFGGELNSRTAVTIGKFDGVHLGHRALIQQLISQAEQHTAIPLVLILEPHPHDYFTKQRQDRVMSLGTKCHRLQSLGIKHIGIVRFAAVADISPEKFITDVLLAQCRCSCLVIGDGFRFGHKQQGTVSMLRSYSREFTTSIVTHTQAETGQIISSSRIKQLLRDGEIAQANQLLGAPYSISGRVIRGAQRGRTLGFPTANVQSHITVPLHGVYCGYANWRGQTPLPAVANIGHNPTFEQQAHQRIEVHLLDTNPTLYGTRLHFNPTHAIRPEVRYNSKEALQTAIQKDIARARSLLGIEL